MGARKITLLFVGTPLGKPLIRLNNTQGRTSILLVLAGPLIEGRFDRRSAALDCVTTLARLLMIHT